MIIYCPVLPKSLTRIAAVHRPVQTYNVIYRVTATDTACFSLFRLLKQKARRIGQRHQ